MAQVWDPARYQRHAGFVPELGAAVLELLSAQHGERILDLGCGDGVLTARLVELGARVTGVDASPEMVEAARARGLDARLMDATALGFDPEFDAVFSNAVLHWVRDQDSMLAGVARALLPGGRFVAELGGHGCVAAIVTALIAVLEARGIDGRTLLPWTFPTTDDYRERLERHGFVVDYLALIPRPTPLPTDMRGWLETFAAPFTRRLPDGEAARVLDDVVRLLKPSLCDGAGRWTADYVRLRVRARRGDSGFSEPAAGARS